jgi:enterochelin esterase-like enzyme
MMNCEQLTEPPLDDERSRKIALPGTLKNYGRMPMLKSVLQRAILAASLFVGFPATAQEPPPAGGVPADWVGCDSTCRARRANPKPDVASPEVSRNGEITIRVYAPKAAALGVGGLQTEVAPMTKGDDGVWTYTSPPLKPGYYRYFVQIDGVDAYDPSNLWIVAGRQRFENVVEVLGGEEFARNDRNIPHGAVAEVFYRSPGVEFERRMRVYTPPEYGLKPETLPTLYLLHGGNGAEDEWGKLGRAGFILDKLIAEGKAKRMIVVMPDGYVADFRAPSGSSPDLLTADMLQGVVPYIEANYTVSKEPKDRAIAGLSRGASQTMTFARQHPGTFNYVGIFSFSRSRVNPLRKEIEAIKADTGWTALRDTLGKAKLVYWSVGTEDAGYPDSKVIWELFKANNVPVAAEPRPGDHECAVWRASLRDFAQKVFQ